MVSGSSVAPSQSHWLEHTQQQRQSTQRQGTVGEQWSSRQIFASTGSVSYSAGNIICNYCNHTLLNSAQALAKPSQAEAEMAPGPNLYVHLLLLLLLFVTLNPLGKV